MDDIGSAVGTATEGALYASAVEDSSGEPLRKGHFAEQSCLNCGTELIGPHCYHCGQQAHLHRTIGAFMHDLLHGALHFEGKTWKTLPLLAFKPGQLTRRYIEGERARFVSPMALFLFSIFLMFAVFQATGISTPTDVTSGAPLLSLEDARKEASQQLAEAEANATNSPAGTERRTDADAELSAARELTERLNQISEAEYEQEEGATLTGIETIDKGLLNKWRKNPALMLYKLQANFYKFSWLLIPISIPFMWIIFAWKRQFKLYDHAIFVTYSLSFMTLLTLVVVLAGLIGAPTIAVVLASTLIPPIHIYKQLRGTYGLSRFSALWRLCMLVFFISLILVLFLQALLLLGAF